MRVVVQAVMRKKLLQKIADDPCTLQIDEDSLKVTRASVQGYIYYLLSKPFGV